MVGKKGAIYEWIDKCFPPPLCAHPLLRVAMLDRMLIMCSHVSSYACGPFSLAFLPLQQPSLALETKPQASSLELSY